MAGGLLGTEDLIEILFVRPVGIACLAGEGLKHPGDAGEFQRAGLCDDEVARDDRGAHLAAPVSQPS
jgi:hypothetical protein